jgi:hypothetical protein
MRIKLAAGALLTLFLVIYLRDVGHGFIKDDFRWIRENRFERLAQLPTLLGRSAGFYRPLVAASFTLDSVLWHVDPFGYALTNLAWCLSAAMLMYALARRFGLPGGASLLAAGVWAFNFHGINMALLWISGRTTLMVTVCALSAAIAFDAARQFTAGLFVLAALLCKEEAVMLPVLFSLWAVWDKRGMARTWPSWAALGFYGVLRARSSAFGPFDAPPYYRFTFEPTVVMQNLVEYLDRAGTLAVVVCTTIIIAIRGARALSATERRVVRFAVSWFATMYAITLFLPVRSSLYAVLPSVGGALATGAIGSAAMRADRTRFARVSSAFLVLLVAFMPVYRARNARWVVLADLSSRVIQSLQNATVVRPAGGRIILLDEPRQRVNLAATFGDLLPDALSVFVAPNWTGSIRTPEAVGEKPCSGSTLCYRLNRDSIERAE